MGEWLGRYACSKKIALEIIILYIYTKDQFKIPAERRTKTLIKNNLQEILVIYINNNNSKG